MATESATDGEPTAFGGTPSVRGVGRALLSAFVSTPGRTTATMLVAGPYLWLGYYVVGTASGRIGDVIVGGDWLTLMFTTYALLSSLALAHRILRIGLTELTVEYLLDVVALTWLTAFYFVWMLARDPVSSETTVTELYAPILEAEPIAVVSVGFVAVIATVSAGIILFPREESRPFQNEFRTALVTYPVFVTALVLVVRPGGESLLWPLIVGIFVGTLLGGLGRIHVITSSIAKGLFAVLSLFVWAVGAFGWLAVYRRRPPNDHVVLAHVGLGVGPDANRERVSASTESVDTQRTGESVGSGTAGVDGTDESMGTSTDDVPGMRMPSRDDSDGAETGTDSDRANPVDREAEREPDQDSDVGDDTELGPDRDGSDTTEVEPGEAVDDSDDGEMMDASDVDPLDDDEMWEEPNVDTSDDDEMWEESDVERLDDGELVTDEDR